MLKWCFILKIVLFDSINTVQYIAIIVINTKKKDIIYVKLRYVHAFTTPMWWKQESRTFTEILQYHLYDNVLGSPHCKFSQ